MHTAHFGSHEGYKAHSQGQGLWTKRAQLPTDASASGYVCDDHRNDLAVVDAAFEVAAFDHDALKKGQQVWTMLHPFSAIANISSYLCWLVHLPDTLEGATIWPGVFALTSTHSCESASQDTTVHHRTP